MTTFREKSIIHETITRGRSIINYLSTSEEYVVYFTDDEHFYDALTTKLKCGQIMTAKRKEWRYL